MSIRQTYAKRGALIVGVPFLLWTLFCFATVYTSNDPSLGAVISFGVALPAVVLGFPWSLLAFPIGLLQETFADTLLETPIGLIAFAVLIATPVLNGALLGRRIGARKEKKLQESEVET